MDNEIYDVVILGTGPAGQQAAIHAARRKVSALVLGRRHKSSTYGAHIENYCCISGVSGEDLLNEGKRQAETSGAVFLEEDVTEITGVEGGFIIATESGQKVETKAIVLAMGISRKKLNVAGEKEFSGRGVSYCVDCDAKFFRNEAVAITGCESAAVSGAMTLLFYASQVHLICDKLEVSDNLIQQLKASEIRLHEGRKIKEIAGQTAMDGVILDDGVDSHIILTASC